MNIKELLTKEFLEEHYINQRKSVKTIAKEFNIKSHNSISQYIKKYGLHRSNLKDSSNILTKEFLEEYYINQNLSLKDVAIKAGFQRKTVVKKALKKHGIVEREHTKSEKFKNSIIKNRIHPQIPSRYFHSLINGANRRDINFEITIDDIWNKFEEQNRKCALSGLEIKFPLFGEKATQQTASLDRINSDFGYTKDNIQWLHKDVNKMKWELSQDRFLELCKLITIKENNALYIY
jgi:predicted DNA-binding protein YlxM (UPF0122 family)